MDRNHASVRFVRRFERIKLNARELFCSGRTTDRTGRADSGDRERQCTFTLVKTRPIRNDVPVGKRRLLRKTMSAVCAKLLAIFWVRRIFTPLVFRDCARGGRKYPSKLTTPSWIRSVTFTAHPAQIMKLIHGCPWLQRWQPRFLNRPFCRPARAVCRANVFECNEILRRMDIAGLSFRSFRGLRSIVCLVSNATGPLRSAEARSRTGLPVRL